jgi:hypothetical protein
MKAHECYHCKQWVEEGEAHDCWTTTETALTKDLSEDLQDAYARIREEAAGFGEQRIYASGSCVMFSRTSCYFFVRPKRQWLELSVFLPRAIRSSLVKRVEPKSKVKLANIVRITHRDQVEAPLTDWMKEAYDFEPIAKTIKPAAKAKTARTAARARPKKKRARPKKKTVTKQKTKAKRKGPRTRS